MTPISAAATIHQLGGSGTQVRNLHQSCTMGILGGLSSPSYRLTDNLMYERSPPILTFVVSSGKSVSTSAISLPRSPHPTYTMADVLEYLDSACEMHVLPQPKAPGMAHVPPSTEGKSTSITRWPASVCRAFFSV